MQRKTPKLIEDIRDAAAFIREVIAGRTLKDYVDDRLLRQAEKRNFEVIGEAMNRLDRIDPTIAQRFDSHRQIIAFRNLLIHGYDVIDHASVWTVIQNHLPTLESEAIEVLHACPVDEQEPDECE